MALVASNTSSPGYTMLDQLIGFQAGLTILVKDLGTSFEPDWLLEGDTVAS